MSNKILVKFITNERQLFDEQFYAAMLPTIRGEIGVLYGHEYLMALLIPGVVKLKTEENDPEKKWEYISVSGGFVDIGKTYVRIMADTAELAEEIDAERADFELQRARQFLAEAYNAATEKKARLKMKKHLARLSAVNLKKKSK